MTPPLNRYGNAGTILHAGRAGNRIGRLSLLLLVSVFIAFENALLIAQPTALTFDTVNKLYYEGKFADAVFGYESLLGSGQKSASIYFNLGNALFKSGQVGRALAAYRAAEQLTPRDPDVRANLRFAQNQVQAPTLSPNRLESWMRRLSLNEWAFLASASLWAFFMLLVAVQLRPLLLQTLRPYIRLSLVTTIILWGCGGYDYYAQRVVRTAIVTIPDAIVRHGPLEASPNAFSVHDGAEMRILGQKDDWLQVSPDPSRIGWIRRDQVVIPAGS